MPPGVRGSPEGGGGADEKADGTTDVLVWGTTTSALQCGHFPLFPAAASLSDSCTPQVGQVKTMGMGCTSVDVRATKGTQFVFRLRGPYDPRLAGLEKTEPML